MTAGGSRHSARLSAEDRERRARARLVVQHAVQKDVEVKGGDVVADQHVRVERLQPRQ
jgi:hypothetical protein